jgi:dTMP kinase
MSESKQISQAGQFIVVEGLEGAGKSTAIATLIERLSHFAIQTKVTREPGGTPIGEILRSMIKNLDYSEVMDDRSELLLLYTSRIQLVEQVIKPALQQGYWVIADRFELSTMAYQGGGRGLDRQMIHQLSSFCLKGLKPQLTLYLDISPEIGLQRAKQRGDFDRIEKEALAFFQRVEDTYKQCIKDDPTVKTIDANRPIHEVQQAVLQAIDEFLEHFNHD